MAVGYARIFHVVRDLTLAMRAIERTINSQPAQDAVQRMTNKQFEELLRLIREVNVAGVRTLIHTVLANDDLTTMSYAALRTRASRLRINRFNKMHKGELIKHIETVEEVLREQLKTLKPPVIGFINGDGI